MVQQRWDGSTRLQRLSLPMSQDPPLVAARFVGFHAELAVTGRKGFG